MNQKYPSYSFRWAASVFRGFQKKYPRATMFVGEIWAINNLKVIKWIAVNPIMWQQYKKVVKVFNTWDLKNPFGRDELAEVLNKRLDVFTFFIEKHFLFSKNIL